MNELAKSVEEREQTRALIGFTLIELLVVISIIGVLASFVLGFAGVSSERSKASLTKAELYRYVTAIEDYKASFNFYPPDNYNSLTRVVNAVTNQLFYELTGSTFVIMGPGRTRFRPLVGDPDPIGLWDPDSIERIFNREGFVNASDSTNTVKKFITLKSSQYQIAFTNTIGESTRYVRSLVAPVPWPRGRTDNPIYGSLANPWRYVSTSPTNNQNSFDLWAEYIVRGKRKTIGNWKE